MSRFGFTVKWLFPLFSSIVPVGSLVRVANAAETNNVQIPHITIKSSGRMRHWRSYFNIGTCAAY